MDTIQAKQLGDKYILLDMLGVGGMAEVYRAKQLGERGFEKQIVIKKLLPDIVHDSEMVNLFIGEARLAAMLQHENIAATYDFGEIDGGYFLAMEYLSGVDLHTLLRKSRELNKVLELQYVLLIVSKVCEGMDYAHRLKDFKGNPLNIIHRDLTPHNIFITYDGKVKVFDFGVAKAEILDNKTQAGIVKGKLSYMSPEQLSGEKIDSRSDIFSIGILLYEMLSGRRMYTGDTAALIQKCLTVDYEHLEEIIPDLPRELYTILDRALERDREERYQSCAQMQADVEDLMFNMGIRSDSKSLQNHVRGLFREEYKAAQEKTTLAMDSTIKVVDFPQQDKTVVMQIGPNEGTGLYGTDTTEQHPTDKAVGSRIFTNKWFLVGGVGLAFIVLATIYLPTIFMEDNITTNSPSTTLNSPPAGSPSVNDIKDNSVIIAELYRKAELSLADNRVVEPTDDCALYFFKKILSFEPGNSKALSGMDRIADHFSDLAEKALDNNRIVESRGYINQGLVEFPQYERLLNLRSQNLQITEVAVSKLAEKVTERIKENKLTTPLDNSAITYLNAIKEIDPDNITIKKGYLEIANRYAILAEDAHQDFNIEKARVYVSRGLSLVPDHKRLLALKAQLAKSKPEVFFKGVEKKMRNLFSN